MRERLTLIFKKNGETLKHIWVVKKGFRGARYANKVRKIQGQWGDPVEIIGDGPIANLLRREYIKYNKDKSNYDGISTKDTIKAGAEITGVPVERIQKFSHKIMRKLRK